MEDDIFWVGILGCNLQLLTGLLILPSFAFALKVKHITGVKSCDCGSLLGNAPL